MLKRNINFYIASLIITLVGSAAALTIVHVGIRADAEPYHASVRQSGEVPALREELKRTP
ncbi:MAG TPA: hypothetical protein VF696_02435 [Candidatus Paceibacterota bacterium]